MRTFFGLLSGSDPFVFPWAYHGTKHGNLLSVAYGGLWPAGKGYPNDLTRWRGRDREALFFAACPSFAAGYAGSKAGGYLLRFRWPPDARAWSSPRGKEYLLKQLDEHRKERAYWRGNDMLVAKKRAYVDAMWDEDADNPKNVEYVSEIPVPPSEIQVFAGTIKPKSTTGCVVRDPRFAGPWVPLLKFVGDLGRRGVQLEEQAHWARD